MSNNFVIPKKEYKTQIRQVNLNDVTIGGENALPFMHSEINAAAKPLVAVEILANVPSNFPDLLRKVWGDCLLDPVKWAKQAAGAGADILAIRFNIEDSSDLNAEIAESQEQIKQILDCISIPVIILGTNREDIDVILLPKLAEAAGRSCTIGVIDENNYRKIIPAVVEFDHNIIARTPIDINLAKELNILITELGFSANKILIDPNMGSLGYGLDYAYSVIERIRLAALDGDTMLNMPIITFVGEESWKAKESKSTSNIPDEWGEIKTRAIMWECMTASSILSAGANIVVLYHPESVKHIKNFIEKA